MSDTSSPSTALHPKARQPFGRWIRKSALPHAFALLVAGFCLFPVVWILSSAFNASNSLASSRLIPRDITFANFHAIFNPAETPIGHWLGNSLYIAVLTAAINTAIAALAAYAFSRFDFKGRRSLLTSLLVMQIFPQFLNFVALYVMARQLGEVYPSIGLNTHAFVILVYIGGAAGFNAFLLKGFLDSVPRSLDEAARIDGAGSLTIFTRIIVPLARPMLAVIFMISFISAFSEFVLASFLLTGEGQYTLPVGLQIYLAEGYNAKWGLLSAIALIGALPIVTIFVVAQKQIIGGLTAGSVKG